MSAWLAKVVPRADLCQDVIGGIEPVTARRCQTDFVRLSAVVGGVCNRCFYSVIGRRRRCSGFAFLSAFVCVIGAETALLCLSNWRTERWQ
ncbi:hypothetical protein [Pseudovibrio sp. Ad26]|uniref:hypothetical protein n=1 Tax=Pseudovibrio sp. Ad26 TaxID=989410 RepID=UPI0007B2F68A|nr:hypothetical protein [Pseudovibrio sp. Ad26]KZK99417.1 hypothetical protein PsAD26_05228 [Pseudovibrio sp. Ad26]